MKRKIRFVTLLVFFAIIEALGILCGVAAYCKDSVGAIIFGGVGIVSIIGLFVWWVISSSK